MKDVVTYSTQALVIFSVYRCICEYKNAVARSHRSSEEGVPTVVEAETSRTVDAVKYLESFIINVSLTNVNAFFIADKKRGKYICVHCTQSDS